LESQQQPRESNLAAGRTVVWTWFRMVAFIFNGWSHCCYFFSSVVWPLWTEDLFLTW